MRPRDDAASAHVPPGKAASAREDAASEPRARAVPDTIQAAPGAIPASTSGGPAPGGNWPVKGDVVSSYGRQDNDGWNTGVSLAAAPSSPVTAPADGTVAFVGEKNGLGHMVIIHGNGLTSRYSNVASGLVPGDAVSAGMEIAKISPDDGFSAAGTAGTVSRMHFEVRRGELAINPESLLA
jgi:septal ring factor EnvC (AmiA/AmiB activator)